MGILIPSHPIPSHPIPSHPKHATSHEPRATSHEPRETDTSLPLRIRPSSSAMHDPHRTTGTACTCHNRRLALRCGLLLLELVELVVLVGLQMPCFASAWSAEWIQISSAATAAASTSRIHPPRSGHVAFGFDALQKVVVFGGYAEEIDPTDEPKTTTTTTTRYPTNDLWELDYSSMSSSSSSDGTTSIDTRNLQWKCVQPAQLWPNDEHDHDRSQQQQQSQPQQRLAAAAASLQLGSQNSSDVVVVGVLVGGWDSQTPGTGGVILNDIQRLQPTVSKDDIHWGWNQDTEHTGPLALEESTSRLVAVPISNQTVLIHNHRCIDSVILLQHTTESTNPWKVTTQPTTGTAPSPRGLHAATYLPDTHRLVVFGGAAQSGDMSNEVFVLDCQTWNWTQVDIVSIDQPTPRASPCLCALDTTSTCVLFGGADRSLADQGVGLHGCNDLWILHLDDTTTTTTTGNVKGRWESITLSTNVLPPGRNAATLTPMFQDSTRNQQHSSLLFLLVGGWYPFQTTHADTYVLKMTP